MEPLWAQLLNSDWHDHRGSGAREDRIGNDAWLRAFLEDVGWTQPRLPDEPEREALRLLRNQLGRIIGAYRVDGRLALEDVHAINQLLKTAPVIRRMDERGTLTLVPTDGSIQQVLAEIVASFAAMLARAEHTRVKVCANPDCGWVIYDESRNQTRRWCSAAECGNLIKVRRHRSRRREAAE